MIPTVIPHALQSTRSCVTAGAYQRRLSCMAHPLESTRLKLARAREHLKQLDSERRAFLDTQPYFYIPHYDFEAGRHEIRARKLADPPMRLGILAGDIIHNYRAALDHLVYEVASLGPRGVAGRGERTQFPVFDLKRDFDSHVATYLKGVPKEAVEVFELLQPYQAGEQLIASIAQLDDRDKHRVLTPALSAPHAGRLNVIGAKYRKVEMMPGRTHLDDGTVVCTFWTDPNVHVQAHFELDTTLLFGDPGGPELTLTDLANFGAFVDAVLLSFIQLVDQKSGAA